MAGNAAADPEAYQRQLAGLERALKHPAPAPGLDAARTGAPAWCDGVHASERFEPGTVIDDLQQYRESGYRNRLVTAAQTVCLAPKEPVLQRAATEIEQYWINLTGLAEADAVASLAARVDAEGFAADRKRLCDAIEPRDDDAEGEAHALANAHAVLFRCAPRNPDTPPWFDRTEPPALSHLTRYLDRSGFERDELARLAWVLVEAWHEVVPQETPEHLLTPYILDQFDFHALSAERVRRALDAAPYRGNRYARIFALESLGQAKLLLARAEAAVAQRAADPEWKEFLVTAPQRGYAAWLAAAERNKEALARSDDFEAASLGSQGGGRGCLPALRADFLAVIKPFKHGDIPTLRQAISDDLLAGLLLDRLVHCAARDGQGVLASRLVVDLADQVRVIRGPKVAAYFAALEALNSAGKRLPVKSYDMPKLEPRQWEFGDTLEGDSLGGAEGVISAVKKTANGLRVTFVRKSHQYMEQECRESSRIERILPDGKVEYRQVCHDVGLRTAKDSPDPTTIPTELAAGIRPGRAIVFRFLDDAKTRSIPTAVFADKTGKHLVAIDGLPLE